MVKNNILFAVLVASFAAPVFASSWLPKNCPLNKEGQLAAATLLVDKGSSRFLGCKPAFEVRPNVAQKPTVIFVKSEEHVDDLVAPVVSPVVPAESLKNKVLNSNVTVGLNTVGINGTLQVNVVPLVRDVVAAAALLKAVDFVTAKLTSAKK